MAAYKKRGPGGGDLFSDFMMRARREIPRADAGRPESVGAWMSGAWKEGATPLNLPDGGLFTFDRHEYLMEPYADDHADQTHMSATQMGKTTMGVGELFFAGRFRDFRGIMYFFPSRKGVSDFVATRINPFMAVNPEEIKAYITETDSVAVKRMRSTNLIFRGAKALESVLSDPADMVILDEFNLFDAARLHQIRGRMAHSDHAWERKYSNPELPDDGVDKEFRLTDQRFWHLKCPRCGQYTDIVRAFVQQIDPKRPGPEVLVELSDGRVIRRCMHCKQGELSPGDGLWVPDYPSVTDKRGRQYSQLFSTFKQSEPGKILHQARTTDNMQAFYNMVLGLPFVAAENRLAMEEVLAMCGTHGLESSDPGPCVMGVDQGPKEHFVVIAKANRDATLYVGRAPGWEDLDRLADVFNCTIGVVDMQPETRAAKAFCERQVNLGRRFNGCYYTPVKHGKVWNDEAFSVSANRNETLDESHAHLLARKETLPRRCPEVEILAQHFHNMAKKREEDDEGNVTYRWVNLGPDHFRHAFNYMHMARARGRGSFFGNSNMG